VGQPRPVAEPLARPPELRRDLSTGIALAFSRLDAARRDELAAGCVAIENNHYDTDGACALFAVRHPEAALSRERALLDAAAAGDFYQLPSEDAFCVDAVVAGVADTERSPIAAQLGGLADRERHERATHWLLGHLPGLLDGDLGPWRALWEPELEDLRFDLARLGVAARDELVHLDWTVWSSTSREPFDPSRHALFGSSPADRVLAIGARDGGWTYRFVLSTLSWFDLVERRALPRPDLGGLALRLNGLEGTDPAGALAWRTPKVGGASPELWFGTQDHERFAERCPALRPSRLEPARVRREVADALRGALMVRL
jgi:hypothetical protein